MPSSDDFEKRLMESAAFQALVRRVAELEQRAAPIEIASPGTASGAARGECPGCGSDQFHRVSTKPDPVFGSLGFVIDHWECGECEFEEDRQRDSSQHQ
jgi:hypothetical protein